MTPEHMDKIVKLYSRKLPNDPRVVISDIHGFAQAIAAAARAEAIKECAEAVKAKKRRLKYGLIEQAAQAFDIAERAVRALLNMGEKT